MNESSPSAQHGFSQNNVSFKHINPPLFVEDISKSYSRPTFNNPASNSLNQSHSRPISNNPTSNSLNQSHSRPISNNPASNTLNQSHSRPISNNPASNTLNQSHSRPTSNNPASNTLNQSHSKDIKQKRLVSFHAPSQERRKSSKNKSFKFVNDPTTDSSNRRNSISIRKSSTGQKVFTLLDNGGGTSFETFKPKELKSLKTEAPKELKIDYLSKAVFKEGHSIRGETFDDILYKDITDDYLQCMYVVSSYTINNYFGVPGPKSDGPQKLSNFLNQLIPLNPSLIEENLEKSKHIPSPTFVIAVQVIEAVDLMAMDADGLSDPFCKIWLNDKEQLSKKTEIKEGTLNPVWNETFQFYLEDIRSDTIYIEIWDRDPIGLSKNLQQIKKVKSLGGCWYFCKDLMEDICTCSGGSVDDLIGKTEIEVGDLFAESSDEWLSLEKESGEFQKGLLHVAVKIEAVRPEDNNEALKRHLLLVKLCLEYGLKNYESSDFSIFCWDQILNTSARTLLFQHGLQSNINAFEDMACRFITVIHLALDHLTFAFQFLYNVLNETNENLNHLQSLSDNRHFYSDLQDAYQQALENLRSICTSVLSSLHTFDLTDDEAKRVEFQYILKCLSLYEDITKINSDIWITLKNEADDWCAKKAEEIKSLQKERRSEDIIKFLNFLRSYQKAADGVVQSVFLDKTYTSEVYEIFERHLWQPVRHHVNEVATESRTLKKGKKKTKKREDALEIFRSLKKISSYLSTVLQHPQFQIPLHEWFGSDTIHEWYAWKKDIVSARIEMSIVKDELQNKLVEFAGRYEKQTNSVQQSADLIQKEYCEIWELVSEANCFECEKFFIHGLHGCCMKYTDALIEQIHLRKLVENFSTSGKNALCAIANDLWAMACFAGNLIEGMGIELQPKYPCTKVSLQMVCKILVSNITQEIKPDIADLIKALNAAKNKTVQDECIQNYLSFISNLIKKEAANDMAFEVYLLFLHNVWSFVLRIFLHIKDKPQRVSCTTRVRKLFKRKFDKYGGLLRVLNETEQMCYMDKKGKLKEIMFTEEYNNLKKDLEEMSLNR